MEDILIKLKKEMMTSHNRKLAQPPEGNFCNLVLVGSSVFVSNKSLRTIRLLIKVLFL